MRRSLTGIRSAPMKLMAEGSAPLFTTMTGCAGMQVSS